MVYSNKFRITLSIMTIMTMMVLSLGIVLAASNQARLAGYHAPLYTNTIVDYEGLNVPIVISGGLITNNHVSVSGANSYIHLNDGDNRITMGLGPITDGLGRSAGSDDFYIRTRFRASSGSNNIHTVFLDAGGVRMFGRNGLPELFTVLPAGNVGIGINNPTRSLDILQSTANSDSGLVVRSGTGSSNVAGHLWAGTGGFVIDSRNADLSGNSNLHLRTGGADRIYIRGTDGNVGIGTSTPSYKLEVVGTGRFTGAVSVGAPTNSGHAANRQYVDEAIAGLAGSISTPSSNLWNESGANIYRLEGNLGLGIEHPVAKLHVQGISGGSCIGTANSCSYYSASGQAACLSQAGCSYSSYNCNTITNENVCVATVGCTPSYGGGSGGDPLMHANGGGSGAMVICEGGTHTSCSGTANQCYTFLNQASCGTTVGVGQKGCSWIGTSAIFDQKVGIGTLWPQELLHVNGDVRVEGNLQVNRGGIVPAAGCPFAPSGHTRVDDWTGFGCMYTRERSYSQMNGDRQLSASCPWNMRLVSGGCAWQGSDKHVHKNQPEMINGVANWVCQTASSTGTKVTVICI